MYPCCECCLTDTLHPDHHEVPCTTCNNPTADRLRAELARMTEARDNARAEVERLTALVERVVTAARTATPTNGHAWAEGHREAVEQILGAIGTEP